MLSSVGSILVLIIFTHFITSHTLIVDADEEKDWELAQVFFAIEGKSLMMTMLSIEFLHDLLRFLHQSLCTLFSSRFLFLYHG